MFTNQSTDISLSAPCRALDAVRAEHVENIWVAATCARRGPNTLSLLQYHSEVNELSTAASVDVDYPVRCVACSPTDPHLVLAAPEQGSAATLWKLPSVVYSTSYEDDLDRSSRTTAVDSLEEVCSLLPQDGFGANIVDIAWRSSSDDPGSAGIGDVLTLDTHGHLTRWDVETAAQVRGVDTNHGDHLVGYPRVAWDPHAHGHAAAVTTGASAVAILDWRADQSVPTGTCARIAAAHRGDGVADVDYNPNKPYVLATAGQDGTAKFWDLRLARQPLLTARGGHSHWVSSVRYNPFHDQLVLTTGTDAVANLWRLSTISSAPLLHDTDVSAAAAADAAPNVRVSRHEHGDSVYAAAWGAADAWIYMTVSFDGKAVLSHVPSKEKYKILL